MKKRQCAWCSRPVGRRQRRCPHCGRTAHEAGAHCEMPEPGLLTRLLAGFPRRCRNCLFPSPRTRIRCPRCGTFFKPRWMWKLGLPLAAASVLVAWTFIGLVGPEELREVSRGRSSWEAVRAAVASIGGGNTDDERGASVGRRAEIASTQRPAGETDVDRSPATGAVATAVASAGTPSTGTQSTDGAAHDDPPTEGAALLASSAPAESPSAAGAGAAGEATSPPPLPAWRLRRDLDLHLPTPLSVQTANISAAID